MTAKKNIISAIIFYVYLALFIIFVLAVFVSGEKIGGSIYFVCFATNIAFASLERKYASSFENYYRFFIYVTDLVNVFALSALLYYGANTMICIFGICALVVCFLVDLFCKNRANRRDFPTICVNICTCLIMAGTFPYFFFDNIEYAILLIAVIFSYIALICKLVLAIQSYKDPKQDSQEKEEKSNLESLLDSGKEEDILE